MNDNFDRAPAQFHMMDMEDDRNVEDESYQIIPVDKNLPLNQYKENFCDYFVEYMEKDPLSLYTEDAIRIVEFDDGEKIVRREFDHNHGISLSYNDFPISDIKIFGKSISRTEYLIHLSLNGTCMFLDQIRRIDIKFLQHALNDEENDTSYLIAFENVHISNQRDTSLQTTSKSSGVTFNFSNKKQSVSTYKPTKNITRGQTVAKKSNQANAYVKNNSDDHYNANNVCQSNSNNTDPTSNSNNSIQDRISYDTLAQNIFVEDKFSVNSNNLNSQNDEKQFLTQPPKHSVPLVSNVVDSHKSEDTVNRKGFSRYAASFNQRPVNSDAVRRLIAKDGADSNDGEQKMPSNLDKFNGNRSNYANNKPYRNASGGMRNQSNRSKEFGNRNFNNKTESSTKELYISNINDATTERALNTLFSQFGEVANVVLRKTRNNTSYAHVKFNSEDEAKSAVEKNNVLELEGEKLIIKYRHLPKPGSNFSGQNDKRMYQRRQGQGSNQNSPRKATPVAENWD